MSQPNVSMTELDGALGVLPPSAGLLHAIVGVSSKGPTDTPATYARVKDVIADFGGGPMVEAAAHYIERYGRPVIVVRTAQTVPGSATAITDGVAGTSVVTRDVSVVPIDDFEFRLEIVTGGTLGVAGITLRWSLDDGRTWSAVTALGVALTFTVPATAPSGTPAPGIKVDFAAGTLIAGDNVTFRTSAPQWNASELGLALDALRASVAVWREVQIVGPLDASSFDTVETKVAGMATTYGKFRAWIGHARIPTIGEAESAYLTALNTIFAVKTTVLGMLCAGACEMTSSVSGRKYLRAVSLVVAAREASVEDHIDTAALRLGSLNVSIRDADGNPKHHDESNNPGLDDARFTVLRTWEGRPGVFVNRPRLFSSETSDFQLLPHRRVMNLARKTVRAYLEERLNEPVRVDQATGFILEAEAQEIESGAVAALSAALLATPKASGVSFVLSRTDNLLATRTLNYQARVIPLGYVEFLTGDIAFENPALRVQSVA